MKPSVTFLERSDWTLTSGQDGRRGRHQFDVVTCAVVKFVVGFCDEVDKLQNL